MAVIARLVKKIRAIKAAIRASLSGSGGGVIHRSTHIRDNAAIKKGANPAIARDAAKRPHPARPE